MIRRKTLFIWITAAAVLIAGGGAAGLMLKNPTAAAYKDPDGTRFTFKTQGDRFLKYEKDGTWKEIFVKGVNLGATVPGHFPGSCRRPRKIICAGLKKLTTWALTSYGSIRFTSPYSIRLSSSTTKTRGRPSVLYAGDLVA